MLVLGNLFFLDYVLTSPNSIFLKDTSGSSVIDTAKDRLTIDRCGDFCKEEIAREIEKVTISASAQLTPKLESITPSKTIKENKVTKDDYVVFGSGTNMSTDWGDVPGLEAYADNNSYGVIKEVIFETSVQIPTGNETAYVRLYNKTDQHPVWYSEVSIEGGEAKFLQSKPISLDSGKKLYKVQMKTTLAYPANLIQSRIHIIHN